MTTTPETSGNTGDEDEWTSIDADSFRHRFNVEADSINNHLRTLDHGLIDIFETTRCLSNKTEKLSGQTENLASKQDRFREAVGKLEWLGNQRENILSDLEADNKKHRKDHSSIVARQAELEMDIERVQNLEKRFQAQIQSLVSGRMLVFDRRLAENIQLNKHILHTGVEKVNKNVSDLQAEMTKLDDVLKQKDLALAMQSRALRTQMQSLSGQTGCSLGSLTKIIDNLRTDISTITGDINTFTQNQKNHQQEFDTFKKATSAEYSEVKRVISLRDENLSSLNEKIKAISRSLESFKGTTLFGNEHHHKKFNMVNDMEVQDGANRINIRALLGLPDQIKSLREFTIANLEDFKKRLSAQEIRHEGMILAIEEQLKTKLMNSDTLREEVLEMSRDVSNKTIEQDLRGTGVHEGKLRSDTPTFAAAEQSKHFSEQVDAYIAQKMEEWAENQESKFRNDNHSFEANVLAKVGDLVHFHVNQCLGNTFEEFHKRQHETTAETKIAAQVTEHMKARDAELQEEILRMLEDHVTEQITEQVTEQIEGISVEVEDQVREKLEDHITEQITEQVTEQIEEISVEVESQVREKLKDSTQASTSNIAEHKNRLETLEGRVSVCEKACNMNNEADRNHLEKLEDIDRRLLQMKPYEMYHIGLLISFFIASSLVDDTLDLPAGRKEYNYNLISHHPRLSVDAKRFFADVLRTSAQTKAGQLLDETSIPKEIPELSLACTILGLENPCAKAAYSEMFEYVTGEKVDCERTLEAIPLVYI